MPNDLSCERARELFDYCPDTGILTWRVGHRCGHPAGYKLGGYVYVKVNGVVTAAHRIAWVHYYGVPFQFEGDHKDRDRSHNAISNLRDATPTQNKANSKIKSTNKTGFKGVCFDARRGRYRADIRIRGQKKTLGYFDDAEAASKKYNLAAIAAHGAFALVGESEQ